MMEIAEPCATLQDAETPFFYGTTEIPHLSSCGEMGVPGIPHGKGGALPKFGEWDVNNPASADGFTVIFAKARDEKKATGTAAHAASIPQQQPTNPMPQQHEDYQYQQKRKWLCCFS
ncbi:protein NOI4-like isoform X2 [Primulina eburnea]|uniref:protein NOI4-like isoform X2 n=1 Tax=Primulina eburnea TaxID=1245227 RepID=UPI003C6C69E6